MNHKLHIYTGDGKGKTTAAMGLALRSLGHGNRVLVAQFLKDGKSGELSALAALHADIMTAPPVPGFTFRMNDNERASAASEQTEFARQVMARISLLNPDTIILDELNTAVSTHMVDLDTALALIEVALRSGETVSTGRGAPQAFLDRADYISRITAERHPYKTEKLPARKGVEW